MQHNEARMLEDVPRHEPNVILCWFFFFAEIWEKDNHRYNEPESLTVMWCSLGRHISKLAMHSSI